MSWLKKVLGGKGANREKATKLVTEGFVHAREGRLDAALRSYERALDEDDAFAVAWLNLGLSRLDVLNRDLGALDLDARAGALDRIAGALERALELDGAPIVGWRALARVSERRGAFARAEDAWACVETLAGVDSAETTEARKARHALARRARAERVRARALAALGREAQPPEQMAALAELKAVLEHPLDDDGTPLMMRGAALAGTLARRAGDRASARALLETAVSEDATDLDALRELASTCIDDGDLARALHVSMVAYRASPADAGLVCNVGVCHLAMGDLVEAAEFIELAHRLDPRGPIVARAREALARAQASSSSGSSG